MQCAEPGGNSHFRCDRKLTEFIDDVGEENGHYLCCLKPERQLLNRFALILTRNGRGGVTFADEAIGAIINAYRPLQTDFFRELFDNSKRTARAVWS